MRFENALFFIIEQGSQIDTHTAAHFHLVLFLLKHLVETAVGYMCVCAHGLEPLCVCVCGSGL